MYLDSDNWLKGSIEYENDQFQHLGSVVTNQGYSDWATTEIDASVKSMWYRFSRREDDYCIECSNDGVTFKQMRVCHMWNGGGVIQFGIYACSPEDSSFKAIFTNMEEIIKNQETVIEPLFEEYVDFETFSKSDFRVVKVKECSAVKKNKKLLHFVLDDGTGTDRIILSGIHAFYEPEELVGKTLLAITNLPPRKMMGIDSCGMLMSAVHNVGGEEKLNLVMLDDSIPAGAKLY